jgi:hypothetical protein
MMGAPEEIILFNLQIKKLYVSGFAPLISVGLTAHDLLKIFVFIKSLKADMKKTGVT